MTEPCYVCQLPLDTADAHTYHGEPCPLRFPEPHTYPSIDDCIHADGCGNDVHDQCCPTCTGQAS